MELLYGVFGVVAVACLLAWWAMGGFTKGADKRPMTRGEKVVLAIVSVVFVVMFGFVALILLMLSLGPY